MLFRSCCTVIPHFLILPLFAALDMFIAGCVCDTPPCGADVPVSKVSKSKPAADGPLELPMFMGIDIAAVPMRNHFALLNQGYYGGDTLLDAPCNVTTYTNDGSAVFPQIRIRNCNHPAKFVRAELKGRDRQMLHGLVRKKFALGPEHISDIPNVNRMPSYSKEFAHGVRLGFVEAEDGSIILTIVDSQTEASCRKTHGKDSVRFSELDEKTADTTELERYNGF